jgi:hypothetical protein
LNRQRPARQVLESNRFFPNIDPGLQLIMFYLNDNPLVSISDPQKYLALFLAGNLLTRKKLMKFETD